MFSNNILHITKEFYYTVYKIKNRVIFAPCDELKNAQKYLLNSIKWVYPLKMDTLKSVKIHTGRKWILKMDIKDFYGSVPIKDITEILSNVGKKVKNFNLFYNFNLVTINGKLPTGAITSAHIANASFKKVEEFITDYCDILDVDFTRYMDDLTFSSNEKQILKIVEKRVSEILTFYGYKVNKRKTKYISDNKQQNILGIVVNDNKIRLSKNYKKQIRAMVHNYVISFAKTKDFGYPKWTEKECNRLKGILAYLKHIEPEYYKKIKIYYHKLLRKMCIKNDKFEKFIG